MMGYQNEEAFKLTIETGEYYRAQEFPNGSPTTISTYSLRITKT